MKRTKRKIFGIGAIVLLVLLSMTPIMLGDPMGTQITQSKNEKVEETATEDECPICPYKEAKLPMTILGSNPFGAGWGWFWGYFAKTPIGCLAVCLGPIGFSIASIAAMAISILSGVGFLAALLEAGIAYASAVNAVLCYEACISNPA